MDELDPTTLFKCQDCGKEMTLEETDATVGEVGFMVGLGGPVQHGGCPDCGGQVLSQRETTMADMIIGEEEDDGGQESSGQG